MRNFKFIAWLFISTGFLLAEKTIHLEKVVTIPGYYPGDQFGCFIQNVGDINNDGYQDLGITTGAYPDSSHIYPWTQRIDIYYGGSPFDIDPDITFWKYVYMGGAACPYGNMDLNGDGYTDLVISDPRAGYQAGIVWIYLGGKDGPDSIADLTLYGEGMRYGFGCFIATGDLNADSYDDLVISSPSDFIADYGRVYVYLGAETLDGNPDWFYESPDEFANYGGSISCGDMNNDGYDDWIVIASYSLSEKPARLYIYSGGDSLSLNPVFQYESKQYTGGRTEYISNWNNSEYGMLLTAYLRTEEINHGVLAIHGSDNFDNFKIDTLISPFGPQDQYFFYGFAQGYLNDDEYKDIMIESDYYIMDASSICVYLDGSGFSQPDTILYFRENSDSTWLSLIGTIDLNADGIDEVIIRREVLAEGQGYWKKYFNYIDIYSHKPFPVITDKIDNAKKLKPDKISLKSNYPNPFNVSTAIPFEISNPGNVTITIYDLIGRVVAVLTDRYYDSGKYSLIWNTGDISSGVYFIRMKCGNVQSLKKTVLLK